MIYSENTVKCPLCTLKLEETIELMKLWFGSSKSSKIIEKALTNLTKKKRED
jgi:hypothetical protein